MTRIILALLALLGFAAQAAHAEAGARVVRGAQVGAVQTVGAQGQTASVAAKGCAPPAMRESRRTIACLPIAHSPSGWRAPTVLAQVDRARE